MRMMTARSIDPTELICKECHRVWPRLVPARWSNGLDYTRLRKAQGKPQPTQYKTHIFPSSPPSRSESTIKFVPRSTLLSIPHITVVRIGKGGGRALTWGRWSAISPGRPSHDQPPTNVDLRHPYSESFLSRPMEGQSGADSGAPSADTNTAGALGVGRCRG